MWRDFRLWTSMSCGLLFKNIACPLMNVFEPKFLTALEGILVGTICIVHLFGLLFGLTRSWLIPPKKPIDKIGISLSEHLRRWLIPPKKPIDPPRNTLPTKKIVFRILIFSLLLYAGFLTFIQFRRLIPLYTPVHRSTKHLSEEVKQPAVSSSLPNARIILGDYQGHETKVASSLRVRATVMVSGLEREVKGLIDWGDGTESKGIPIRNDINSFGHSYSSPGSKTVKLSLQTNGQILEIVDSDDVPKKEIMAEIKIPKGGPNL